LPLTNAGAPLAQNGSGMTVSVPADAERPHESPWV